MVERNKIITGVAAAAALTAAPALAAPSPVQALSVASYAELLQPIPDAQAKLAALDSQPAQRSAEQGEQVAQYYYHHHHHHHHHWRRYYYPYRYYHHHHHHHHHHHFYPYE